MEGGRSGDNDGERGGGETILVRGMKSGEYGYDDEKRRHLEFDKVDLKEGGEIEMNCYPKLLTWMSPGVIEYWSKGVRNHGVCLTKANRRVSDVDPSSFGSYLEVYDPFLGGGFWVFIWCPPQIVDGRLSGRVIPDPRNKRILVNLSDGYDLYAYYPLNRTFKLVGSNVYPWFHIVALADNIAYVHQPESSQLLHAFDLSDRAKSLDVVWTSKVFPNIVNGVSYDVKLASFELDALFHVGNNNFWFTVWFPDHQGNSRVYFLKFKASRAGDKIICTPLALRSHLLESSCKVFDFLLLEEISPPKKGKLKSGSNPKPLAIASYVDDEVENSAGETNDTIKEFYTNSRDEKCVECQSPRRSRHYMSGRRLLDITVCAMLGKI
ncbi:hypothetical protein OROHE_009094 [Orobanche hederae]